MFITDGKVTSVSSIPSGDKLATSRVPGTAPLIQNNAPSPPNRQSSKKYAGRETTADDRDLYSVKQPCQAGVHGGAVAVADGGVE